MQIAIIFGDVTDMAFFDAETLVGFYRYFPFPPEEVLPLFPYGHGNMQAAWETVDEFFGGEGRGRAGVAVRPVQPPRGRVGEDAKELPEE